MSKTRTTGCIISECPHCQSLIDIAPLNERLQMAINENNVFHEMLDNRDNLIKNLVFALKEAHSTIKLQISNKDHPFIDSILSRVEAAIEQANV